MNNPTGATALNVDKICEALDENDLTDIVLKADYAIEFCHSTEDGVVAFENVGSLPDKSLLKYEVTGPHGPTNFLCSAKLFAGMTLTKPKIRSPKNKKTKAPKKTKTPKRSI